MVEGGVEDDSWSTDSWFDVLNGLEKEKNHKDLIVHEKYGEIICQAKSNLSDLIRLVFCFLIGCSVYPIPNPPLKEILIGRLI